jgi:hypothetical protein
MCWAPVAHTCNPNYLGGWNWEDHGSRPAWAKSLQDFISKITRAKWDRGIPALQVQSPEFKSPQFHQKKKKELGIVAYVYNPRRPRQKDCQFGASLGYNQLVWASLQDCSQRAHPHLGIHTLVEWVPARIVSGLVYMMERYNMVTRLLWQTADSVLGSPCLLPSLAYHSLWGKAFALS